MDYEYTSVFALRGVAKWVGPEMELEIDAEGALRAFVTCTPDEHTAGGDLGLALGSALLDGFFGGRTSPSLEERVALVQEDRRARHQSTAFLVIVASGRVDSFLPEHVREHDSFVVCFDAFDKQAVRARHEFELNALVNAVTSTMGADHRVDRVSTSIVLRRPDGKPVYSFSFSGSADASVSRGPTLDSVVHASEVFGRLRTDRTLARVHSLLVAARAEADQLKGFLSAFNSLEILVNKVFPAYERRYFERLKSGSSTLHQAYVSRISEIMKGKYSLLDRFSLVAGELHDHRRDPDRDLERVREFKRQRDEIAHGLVNDGASMPTAELILLCQAYLELHVARSVLGDDAPSPGN